MTVKIRCVLAFTALVITGAAAHADDLTDDLVSQLHRQGYGKISISRTLLGRVRILGSTEEGQREIVVNPNTGEILRDYFRPLLIIGDDRDSDGEILQRPQKVTGLDGDREKDDDRGGRDKGGDADKDDDRKPDRGNNGGEGGGKGTDGGGKEADGGGKESGGGEEPDTGGAGGPDNETETNGEDSPQTIGGEP